MIFLWVVCQIKTIVVHRELFIPFKCIARSDGMTKQMRIVQIGKEQHYSLCTVMTMMVHVVKFRVSNRVHVNLGRFEENIILFKIIFNDLLITCIITLLLVYKVSTILKKSPPSWRDC